VALTYADEVQCLEAVEMLEPFILKVSVDAKIAPYTFIFFASSAHSSFHVPTPSST